MFDASYVQPAFVLIIIQGSVLIPSLLSSFSLPTSSPQGSPGGGRLKVRPMSSTAIGTFTCWDGYDDYELVEERPSRPSHPPRRSRLSSTSNLPTPPRRAADRSGERPQTSKSTTALRDQEYASLDELWSTLRERKHAAEAKLPLKVKSLETPQPGPSSASRPTPERHVATLRKVTPPKVKRKKSTYATVSPCVSVFLIFLACSRDCVSFRESRSGRTVCVP